MPIIFLLSLLVPILIPAGPLQLMPHRLFLLVVFVPLLFKLLSGGAGRLIATDFLFMFASLWAALALFVSAGAVAWEPAGIFIIEFFGAYLVARVCLRSTADFKGFLRGTVFVLPVLIAFAIAEAVTHRPILLDLLPNSIRAVYQENRMGMRRAQAVFSHSILYGAFVSSFLGLWWYASRGFVSRVMAYGLIGVGTLVSLSTGALISFVVQTVFIGWQWVFLWLKRRWALFGGLSVLGYIVLDVLSNRTPFHILIDVAAFNTGNAYNRILIWRFGTQNVADNPLFGLGVNGNQWVRPSWMSASADNFWLLMAMTYGLPMLISFVVGLALLMLAMGKADLRSDFDQRFRAGILTALGGLIIAGGTVHYWHAMMAFAMFLFGSGAWLVTGGATKATDDTPAETPTTSGDRRVRFTRFPPRELIANGKAAPPVARTQSSGRYQRLK